MAASLGNVDAGQRQMAKLKDGAREFESMMLGEMLKPMHFGGVPGSEEEGGDSAGDTVQGFGTEALTKAIASGGGFGIARQILRQVTAEHDAQGGKVPGTKV